MFLFNIFLFLISILYTQTEVSIEGRIIDTKGEPVPLANIYVDNSSIGATADLDGYFHLKGIPLGLKRIVISQINYRKEIITFNFLKPENIKRNFILVELINESDEVIVEVSRDDDFKILYNRFKSEFLGPSDFAKECEIINPEYLELEYLGIDGFKGRSIKPIKVINRALGYELEYAIDLLENTSEKYEISGDVTFKNLQPEDKAEEKKWLEARRMVFKYSLRYFLRELYHRRTKSVNIYYSKVNSFPNFTPYPTYDIQYNEMVFPSTNNFKKLKLISGALEVQRIALVNNDYRRFFRKTLMFEENRLIAFLKLYGSIDFNEDGYFIPAGGYRSYEITGYFTFYRVSGLLPEDYDPDDTSIIKSD